MARSAAGRRRRARFGSRRHGTSRLAGAPLCAAPGRRDKLPRHWLFDPGTNLAPHFSRRYTPRAMLHPRSASTFQDMILTLQHYWSDARVRHPAAVRCRGRRRHLPPRDGAARTRPRAVARRVCPAKPPPVGRALRRQPQPARRLLSVPGHPQAVAARHRRRVSRFPRGDRHRRVTAHDIRFVEDDWESPTLGAWGLGWEVWCDGMEVSAVHLFPAGRRHRLRAGQRRDHLWPRTAGDVYPGQGFGLRPRLQRPPDLRRRLPRERARVQRLQLRSRRTLTCCSSSSPTRAGECRSARRPRPAAPGL